jgi:hypothetical protein
MSEPLLDAAGRRRSPATLPQFHAGRPPRNKGIRYPADPPTVEEIVADARSLGQAALRPRVPLISPIRATERRSTRSELMARAR